MKKPSPPARIMAAHQRDGHDDERYAAQEIGADVDEASDGSPEAQSDERHQGCDDSP